MGPVVIVGAGAIGSWLLARAALAGEDDLWILARRSRLAALSAGLTLEVLPEADPDGTGRTEHVAPRSFRAVGDPADLPNEVRMVIIATRAYQTRETVAALSGRHLHPDAAVTLQNGLGNAETLAAAFGPGHVVAGTTTHGVTLLGPAAVRHAGAGDTALGPWTGGAGPRARAVRDFLEGIDVETRLVDDPRPLLWLKVAVNAAINPPTAIHRVENGALLDGGPLEAALRAAAREVAAVAQAEGVDVDPDRAEAAAVAVAERTARNRSSMLQARLAGRRLELDAITGEVVRRAARHGIHVPVNASYLATLGAPA